jgi:hypothetical protein
VSPDLSRPVQSLNDTARILCLFRRNGEPNRDALRTLIREGKLRVIDPTQPPHRWTVATAEIHRYINQGPRCDGVEDVSFSAPPRWVEGEAS